MAADFNILTAVEDENLFGSWFKGQESWNSWKAFLAALFALEMTPEQLKIYQRCTSRTLPPENPSHEAWLVIGRRGGKSFMLAVIACYLACFKDFRHKLAPGERGTVMIIASDRKQARVIMRYVTALLTEIPMLNSMVERQTAESIDLTTRVTLEVHTASFRRTRGYTILAALCDEISFWQSDESANPDQDIIDGALRPAMATLAEDAVLLCASSPYNRRGSLWESYDRWYGKEGAPLVWQAETRIMNPSVPQKIIDEAMERDPARYFAEYGAEFRTDIEAYLSREAIEACIEPDVKERPANRSHKYFAFVDPSGGSADSMTMGIAAKIGETVELACIRERKPPFSPESVVEEFAETCKQYRVTKVVGDRYAGEWVKEQFRKFGVNYELSPMSKSQLYQGLLPLINSRAVDLLDLPALTTQLSRLERKTTRGGRDSIDHPPGAHDDVANAVAGAVVMAQKKRGEFADDEARTPKVHLGYAKTKKTPQRSTPRLFGESKSIPMEALGEDGRYSPEWEEKNAQRKESAPPKREIRR